MLDIHIFHQTAVAKSHLNAKVEYQSDAYSEFYKRANTVHREADRGEILADMRLFRFECDIQRYFIVH